MRVLFLVACMVAGFVNVTGGASGPIHKSAGLETGGSEGMARLETAGLIGPALEDDLGPGGAVSGGPMHGDSSWAVSRPLSVTGLCLVRSCWALGQREEMRGCLEWAVSGPCSGFVGVDQMCFGCQRGIYPRAVTGSIRSMRRDLPRPLLLHPGGALWPAGLCVELRGHHSNWTVVRISSGPSEDGT
ncbi:hypothetical protein M9H77_16919 [Catharanthus roseus]|uniref:Uncharacterized protein n=1 Tax=Catharanthus roseus TaxID=4058 RepID=A0ACC0B328_CATRO|nr:hypothetical protein M9H77_16919 [Catharanthus roseus]